MQHDIYIYSLLMSLVTLAIRIVPLTLIRGEVKSTFLRSFLCSCFLCFFIYRLQAMSHICQEPPFSIGSKRKPYKIVNPPLKVGFDSSIL